MESLACFTMPCADAMKKKTKKVETANKMSDVAHYIFESEIENIPSFGWRYE